MNAELKEKVTALTRYIWREERSKINHLGTSLVVQWLRLYASTSGGMSSIPVQEQRACHMAKRIKTELQIYISHKYRCKNHQQNIKTSNLTMYKKNSESWPCEIMPGLQILVQHSKINVLALYQWWRTGKPSVLPSTGVKKSWTEKNIINKLKKKNHMIISTDAEIAGDKIQNPFMVKNFQ